MQGEHPGIAERLHELPHELRVEIPDAPGGNLRRIAQAGPPGEVYGAERERLVHWDYSLPVALYATLIAEGFAQRLAQSEARVLNRVVAVDLQVAQTFERYPEAAVPRELREHMVEEANPRRNLRRPAVKRERQRYVRLVGPAIYRGGPCHIHHPFAL